MSSPGCDERDSPAAGYHPAPQGSRLERSSDVKLAQRVSPPPGVAAARRATVGHGSKGRDWSGGLRSSENNHSTGGSLPVYVCETGSRTALPRTELLAAGAWLSACGVDPLWPFKSVRYGLAKISRRNAVTAVAAIADV
jgi:hypothetical protein